MNRSLLLKVLNLQLLWPTLLFSQINTGNFVIRSREIDNILNNLGIGITTFQRFNGNILTTLNNKLGWTEGQPIIYQQFKGDLINKQYPQASIAYGRHLEAGKGKYWYVWDSVHKPPHIKMFERN